MNFYKIIDESLSAEMSEYAEAAAAADHAADALAAEIGADTLVPSPYGEFGGILACTFPDNDAPHFFRFAEEMDGVRYYEPAVTVEESVETEGFVRGIDRRQNNRHWYDVHEITLEQARPLITYQRAAELAHIKPSSVNLSSLSRKYRVSPSWMEFYYVGRVDYVHLCGKSARCGLTQNNRQHFEEELRQAMVHEELLNAELLKHKFYQVRHVYGTRDAVRFFRKASGLPLVPSGRLASLLGIQFSTDEISCPAFFKSEGFWYISTSGEISSDKTEAISELWYESAKMKRGEN